MYNLPVLTGLDKGLSTLKYVYLPLFYHFKAIYQFPKHIIFLVKIVANASLRKSRNKIFCRLLTANLHGSLSVINVD
jgi:hypothetical protein